MQDTKLNNEYVIDLEKLSMQAVAKVGGKNASLGEMISKLSSIGIRVPGGFATTAKAYWDFLDYNNLQSPIQDKLRGLDVDNVVALKKVGEEIRSWIVGASFQPILEESVRAAYLEMCNGADTEFSVAVRSSATAEDLPDASFAGQQESFLNVRGLNEVLIKIKQVFASVYNDRAIAYRIHKNFLHDEVALSAGIQRMIRSDLLSSGVMFTIDTESGFSDVVFITANFGLGETVVQGSVNPDEYYVSKSLLALGKPAILSRHVGSKHSKLIYADKLAEQDESVKLIQVGQNERLTFCLSDEQLHELARQAMVIEAHYDRPMDIEWALDGTDNHIYIVQARPETVQNKIAKSNTIERYVLREKGKQLVSGAAVGQRIGCGKAKVINNITEMSQIQDGDVLVTTMTDPDWEPVMKRASAIITDRGGRTCHAAIIARELAVPAIVGCHDATAKICNDQLVTVSCAEGEVGIVYDNKLAFEMISTELDDIPKLPVKIMMNIANPSKAMSYSAIPNAGIGLARLEFIISNKIGIHPNAILQFDLLEKDLKKKVFEKICAYPSPIDFYVQKIVEGVATLATVFAPKPVIVRLSDFKSNEYANLIGGSLYEPKEENPMIGYRGTSRYLSAQFEACFKMECDAIRYARDTMGLTNIWVMVPFVRTLHEAQSVIALLEKFGLKRGENDLKIVMMCELPSNAILAEQFLQYFDGFSIGSNDMTQLTLGLDRDSALVSKLFDERDEAVKFLLDRVISVCRKAGKYVGICGQGPSDHPDFAQWLLERGIDSISLNPDSIIETMYFLAKKDKNQ